MMIAPWLATGIGMASAALGLAGSMEDATYARLFGRAAHLVPGDTAVTQDLAQAGAWEIVGGRRLDGAAAGGPAAMVVDVLSDSVTCIWQGAFPRDVPALHLALDFETPVPARVQVQGRSGTRFNRAGAWIPLDPVASTPVKANLPGKAFDGVALQVEGKGLAGQRFRIRAPSLSAAFREGYFRRALVLPDGEIWDAVAEVGNLTTLYVNGERVDDESVILPRPVSRGTDMYQSKRVPLKGRLRPGRTVLALYSPRFAWLRGAVVLASGERVLLDTGTNWIAAREAPAGWERPDFDDSGWAAIPPAPPGAGDETAAARAARPAVALTPPIHLAFRPEGDMPCYDGVIQLRPSGDTKFYGVEGEPVRLDVRIPPGYRDGAPSFAWELHRYQGGANAPERDPTPAADPAAGVSALFRPVTQGILTTFQARAGTLAAALEMPAVPRGVYVLTGRLTAGGTLVEEREPEPLLVCGKVPMQPVPGDTLEQGLNLALETTVDFTDPGDPHPWFETDGNGRVPGGIAWGPEFYHTVDTPLIVERNGLKYRTTRPVNWAQFSYQVEFAHPGDWYLLALDYPDDAERWIGVACNAASRMSRPPPGPEEADGPSKCGPAIWAGGKYPSTGRMLEMKWLYRPDPGPHAFNVMSLMKHTEAAAARLRLYHVAGRLPELEAGGIPAAAQRRFGMLTERTCPYQSGIYNLFSAFAEQPGGARGNTGAGRRSPNALREACERLRLMDDAASHYAEYLRFAGQNLHTLGCFQYHDRNTAPQFVTGDPRLHYNPQDVLARVLQANGIRFFASVEFLNTFRRLDGPQKDEWYFADRTGAAGPVGLKGSGIGGLNFMHPEIEGDMLALARQLAEAFRAQPNFLGLNWTALFGGAWLPSWRAGLTDPLGLGYDDLTTARFERDTGLGIPADAGAPDRFERRYQFLTSAGIRPRWVAWRAQKLAELFHKIHRTIRAVRPDLETVAGCYLSADHVAEWKRTSDPFGDYLASWGWDPAVIRQADGLWLMPWLPLSARYQPAARAPNYAMAWQGNHDPGFYAPFAESDRRALMLCVGWVEVERIAAHIPRQPGWPRPYQQTMMGQQREAMALEPYTQALIGLDPQMVMNGFTDVSPYVGVEHAQRRFARVLRRLPQGRFEPALGTGFDSNLALRALAAEDGYYFYAANPGYWPVRGRVTLAGAARVADLVAGREVPLQDGAVALSLEPFGIAAFRAEGGAGPSAGARLPVAGGPRLVAWSSEPVPDAELAHLRTLLAQGRAARAKPDVKGFLGPAEYGVLSGGVAAAEQALAERRYAAAWAALTDAAYWTVVFQKVPDMQHADLLKPRTVDAVRVGRGLAPAVDGRLDDPVWDRYARPAGYFVTRDKVYAEWKTRVRAVRVRDRLFVAFECEDPEPDQVRGTAPRDDERKLWEASDDLVAVIVRPDSEHYYQFAVSAGGATFDQRCSVQGLRDYDYAPAWTSAACAGPAGWTAELEIEAAESFGRPIGAAGTEWKINFHRAVRLNRQPVSSWVYSPDWHSMEHMGTLRFVEAAKP